MQFFINEELLLDNNILFNYHKKYEKRNKQSLQ